MQLKCLPSSISYESVELPHIATSETQNLEWMRLPKGIPSEEPQNANPVLRRPTYDIILQLKAEADPEMNQNAELISATAGNDRQSGVYEGGLKTWEGALDLAALVMTIDFEQIDNWHIVELGAGSAIPSMVALQKILALKNDVDLVAGRRWSHFTLSDYNDEVIRLSTVANVLLASKQELDRRQGRETLVPLSSAGSIDVSEDLFRDCHKLWRQVGVSFSFISGPWGTEFVDATTTSITERYSNVLILASETIYDLKSLPEFTDTVINLLRAHGQSSRAWIAAKKLYFGVGGGVDAFLKEVELRGGTIKEIINIKRGVSRVVLEVTYRKPESITLQGSGGG